MVAAELILCIVIFIHLIRRKGTNEFNSMLYELRKQKGISQEELADKLSVSRQTLSKWELGTSTLDMEKLIMISDYLCGF